MGRVGQGGGYTAATQGGYSIGKDMLDLLNLIAAEYNGSQYHEEWGTLSSLLRSQTMRYSFPFLGDTELLFLRYLIKTRLNSTTA